MKASVSGTPAAANCRRAPRGIAKLRVAMPRAWPTVAMRASVRTKPSSENQNAESVQSPSSPM